MSEEANQKASAEKEKEYGDLSKIHADYGKGYCSILIVGWLAVVVDGLVFPVWSALFKEMIDSLVYTENNRRHEARKVVVWFVIVGVVSFFGHILQHGIWGRYGAKVGMAVRRDYLAHLLKQDLYSFHDAKSSGELNAKIVSEVHAIDNAIGVKRAFMYQQFVQFAAGFALAFYYSWQMALVLLATVPALVSVGLLQGIVFMGYGGNADPFVDSHKLSHDVLLNICTVVSFPALVSAKLREYAHLLNGKAFEVSKKRSIVLGGGLGFTMLVMFGLMYSVGLFYGAYLVSRDKLTISKMFGCFFSFMMGGMAIGQLASVGNDLKEGKLAANSFYKAMAREPQMRAGKGLKPSGKLQGTVEFRNVSFAYKRDSAVTKETAATTPNTAVTSEKKEEEKETVSSTADDADDDAKNDADNARLVLENISFCAGSGQTLAIVGPSGSGKSTVVSLLLRFYDPRHGQVLIDGVPIHDYDVESLREQIGYVSQLPLLFDATVRENVRAGRSPQIVTDLDVENACRKADAHEFITRLSQGYDTFVGQMGSRLSGGQKQRIAIARAIVSKPSILLLDEATSALDTNSEREVQRAIDNIASGSDAKPTIVTIAHRLSTIKNADSILVLVEGSLEEVGSHSQLMQNGGVYAALVRSQDVVTDSFQNM